MAAITADTARRERKLELKIVETAPITTGQTVYVGGLINRVIASNRVRGAASSVGATHRFAGVVTRIINESGAFISAGTGNTAGTVKAEYAYGHQVELPVKTSNATLTNVGLDVFALNNGTVSDATAGGATAGARCRVGELVELNTTTDLGWVWLRHFTGSNAVTG